MKRVLRKGTHRFEILDRGGLGPEQEPEHFSDEFFAVRFVRGFLPDSLSMMTFRNILAKGVHGTGVSTLSDGEVLEQIAKRIRTGQLRINRLPMPVASAVSAEPAAEEEPEEAPAAPAAVEEAAHWIEFRVVDDESGDPIEGVALKLKLPTGEVQELTTDSAGTIRVSGLPDGTCDIEEMIDSDALEVVEIS